jgi:hypothetical protein
MCSQKFFTAAFFFIVVTTTHADDPLFGIGQNYPAGGGPHSVFVADLNDDGFADVIIADDLDMTVSVHFNTGTGTFGPGTAYDVDSNPLSVFAADSQVRLWRRPRRRRRS